MFKCNTGRRNIFLTLVYSILTIYANSKIVICLATLASTSFRKAWKQVIKEGIIQHHLLQDQGHKMLPLLLPLNVQSQWCQGYHRTSWLYQQQLISQGVLLCCDKHNKTHGAPEVKKEWKLLLFSLTAQHWVLVK